MIPSAFNYHRPQSLSEAVRLLQAAEGDGLPLAGGHSLLPMMKARLAAPACLVDLAAIEQLRGIKIDDKQIALGAMTTQHEVINHAELAKACPLLAQTAGQIADPQVRYCGTVGGNAANGDPGNDMPAVMQALNAQYLLVGAGGERLVAARDYYEGAFFTARQDDEILAEIRIPVPARGHGSAYIKQKRKVGDYATAAVAVVLSCQKGKIADAAIALTNLADKPILAQEAASLLCKADAADDSAVAAAAKTAADLCDPAADRRGPPEFRKHLAQTLAKRAIAAALAACA